MGNDYWHNHWRYEASSEEVADTLSWWQRFKLRWWADFMPWKNGLWVSYCHKHGYFVNYLSGKGHRISCLKCK